MSSTQKKRPKPPSNAKIGTSPSSYSSYFKVLAEPPKNIFPSKQEFSKLIVVLAVASFVAMICNLLASSLINPHPKPFCNRNLEPADLFSDSCEPCPSNGECYDGKLECFRGYRKHGKLCIEDGDINEAAKKISERAEYHLCEAYAQYLCYGSGTFWVHEYEVWNHVDGSEIMKNVVSDDNLYNYTKQKAMETIRELFEMRTNALGVKELKCPDLLVEHYKPFSCHIKQWTLEHAQIILPVFAMLAGCIVLLWKVLQEQRRLIRVEELYNQVCEMLEENALMSKSEVEKCEPWIVASRLRDHLLLPRERKDPMLWKKVEEVVQEDSRIDRYPKVVKGESKVVWEWQVEGSLSSSRRRKNQEASNKVLAKPWK